MGRRRARKRTHPVAAEEDIKDQMELPSEDLTLLEELGLPMGFGGTKGGRLAGRGLGTSHEFHSGEEQYQECPPVDDYDAPPSEVEGMGESCPSEGQGRRKRRRKRIETSQMTVFSDELSVKKVLAYYPKGLNYALQPSTEHDTHINEADQSIHIANATTETRTARTARTARTKCHIKFDDEGEPTMADEHDMGTVEGGDADAANDAEIASDASPVYEDATKISNPSPDSSPESPTKPVNLKKYHRQRYDFFHRYDEGIQIDEEGWFSVTPESIASHIATTLNARAGRETLLVWDAFAGVGGNAIQFAHAGAHVIATDIDGRRLMMAAHNATIYGVRQYIDFLQVDALQMDRIWRRPIPQGPEQTFSVAFDTAFLSPPWGGPEYSRVASFDLFSMIPLDFGRMLKVAHTLAPHDVIYYLPRNTNVTQLAKLLPPGSLRLMRYFLADRLKLLVAIHNPLKSVS